MSIIKLQKNMKRFSLQKQDELNVAKSRSLISLDNDAQRRDECEAKLFLKSQFGYIPSFETTEDYIQYIADKRDTKLHFSNVLKDLKKLEKIYKSEVGEWEEDPKSFCELYFENLGMSEDDSFHDWPDTVIVKKRITNPNPSKKKKKKRIIRIIEESDEESEEELDFNLLLPGCLPVLRNRLLEKGADLTQLEFYGKIGSNGTRSPLLRERKRREKFRWRDLPEHQDQCICGTGIKVNVYIRDMSSHKFYVIGTTCLEKMGPSFKLRKCWDCENIHKGYSFGLCKKCRRKKRLKNKIVQRFFF